MEDLDPQVIVFLGFPKTREAGRWQLTQSSPDLSGSFYQQAPRASLHQKPSEVLGQSHSAQGKPRITDPDTTCSVAPQWHQQKPDTVSHHLSLWLEKSNGSSSASSPSSDMWKTRSHFQLTFPQVMSLPKFVPVPLCRLRGSSELLSSGYKTKFCCCNRMVLQDAQTKEQVTVVPLSCTNVLGLPVAGCLSLLTILQKMSGIDFFSQMSLEPRRGQKNEACPSAWMTFSPTGKSWKSHCKSWKIA